jgi:hypothetical protein
MAVDGLKILQRHSKSVKNVDSRNNFIWTILGFPISSTSTRQRHQSHEITDGYVAKEHEVVHSQSILATLHLMQQ